MSWKDNLKKGIDYAYKFTKEKYSDIKFPCYGGRYYRSAFLTYSEYIHLYLTETSVLYTASGIYITEIPFKSIRKLSIKKDALAKAMFHIRLVADKKYHLYIYCKEHFSTELTGNAIDNVRNFIEALQLGVNSSK